MRLGARRQRTTDDARRTTHDGPGGFTLVELLVVIVVLGILIALLLPAINSAIKTARNAAVLAEINQLAQALESFKSTYGDYPPSRVLLVENGNYSTYIGNNSSLLSVRPELAGHGRHHGGPARRPDHGRLPEVLAEGPVEHQWSAAERPQRGR